MARLHVIGCPMDLGASRRGVDMGPSALRIAQIGRRLQQMGHEVTDGGDVLVPIAESQPYGDSNTKFLPEIAAVCTTLAQATYAACSRGCMPVVLGGDHSIAVGTMAGVAKYHREREQKLGLIWLDAHGDFNTPATSPTGNVHGMPLAHIAGLGAEPLANLSGHCPSVEPGHIAVVGVRDLDPEEKRLLREANIEVFTMRTIDERGLGNVMKQAVAIATNGTAGFHVSFDADWLDPSIAPGVGTPVLGGATYREGHLAMEVIADSKAMVSLEAVEVNPVLDQRNATANIVAGMVLSAFGKKIF